MALHCISPVRNGARRAFPVLICCSIELLCKELICLLIGLFVFLLNCETSFTILDIYRLLWNIFSQSTMSPF